MKDLLSIIPEIEAFIAKHSIRTLSFDIDGTLYPMTLVERNWWKYFVSHPIEALRFLRIRKRWEKKRLGEAISVPPEDIRAFEDVLLRLLTPQMVQEETRQWLRSLQGRGLRSYYLTDHSVRAKLTALRLPKLDGEVDGLSVSGELKPHPQLAAALLKLWNIEGATHVHIGDRWSDEAQAKLLGAHFIKVGK